MELDTFKLLAQKALDLGFVIVEEKRVKRLFSRKFKGKRRNFHSLDKIDFNPMKRYYFYLKEAGKLIIDTSWIDSLRSPVIEAGFSKIHENKISRARLWVSSGYYNDDGEFIKRPDILNSRYTSLVRYVKKLLLYKELPFKPNSLTKNNTYVKWYITPYLFDLVNTTTTRAAFI